MYQTSDHSGYARVPVDIAQTSLYEGREFRFVRKLSLTQGVPFVFKFVCPVDFILTAQDFGVSVGDIEFYAYLDGDATEDAAFNDAVPVFDRNTSAEKRNFSIIGSEYARQAVVTSGGSLTLVNADDYADYDRIKVGAQPASIARSLGSEQYMAAGTYFLMFQTETTTAEGRFVFGWEERPSYVQSAP